MKVSIKNSIVNELHQPTHSDIAAVALINQTVTTAAKKATNFLQAADENLEVQAQIEVV
jgi:hypothetical protein